MSSFLAPIHFWLYNKIQIQEALIRTIAETARDEGFLPDSAAFIREPLPELSTAIDVRNIHGWLQDKIASSETSLACLVMKILSEDENRLNRIVEIAETFGKNYAVPPESTAQQAYKAIDDTLLNGMPCDMAEAVVERNHAAIVWKNTKDTHAPYWEETGGSVAYYWKIRAAVIRGLLSQTNLLFTEQNTLFKITAYS